MTEERSESSQSDFGSFREVDFQRWLEQVLPELLPLTSLNAEPSLGAGLRPDFVGQYHGDRPVIIEVIGRLFKTRDRILGAAQRLERYGEEFVLRNPRQRTPDLILIAPIEIPQEYVELLAARRVTILDGPHLAALLTQQESPIPWFLEGQPTRTLVPLELRSRDLAVRLSSIRPGKLAWSEYQSFCGEVLANLFCPPLMPPIPELATASKTNRRDFILPNYSTEGFWYYLRREYRADFLVVDAKNYTKGVGKGQILQMANYLNAHGVGLVGVILSRVPAQKAATLTAREQWILHRKLIVILEDGDVHQMLANRRVGADPAEVLRQLIEDFRLSF